MLGAHGRKVGVENLVKGVRGARDGGFGDGSRRSGPGSRELRCLRRECGLSGSQIVFRFDNAGLFRLQIFGLKRRFRDTPSSTNEVCEAGCVF